MQDNGTYAYSTISGFSAADTSDALAEFATNPFIFRGLPASTLEMMGLPADINSEGYLDSDAFKTLTDNDAGYQTALTSVQNEVKIYNANTQVASYRKLISTIPEGNPKVMQYFMYQLNSLQTDPEIKPYLTGINAIFQTNVPNASTIAGDFMDIVDDPHFFSINAAWDAQTGIVTDIDDFSDDQLNHLPSWFSLETTDPNTFGIDQLENLKLANAANLQQQLGLYDYDLDSLGSDGGKIFNDAYTYKMNTLTDLQADLDYLKTYGNIEQINTVDAADIIALYHGYSDQYQRENSDANNGAALQTIINKLQLAIDGGNEMRVYSELDPDGNLVASSSQTGDLSDNQLAYYQALVDDTPTLYKGYSTAALLTLGLNVNLANGALPLGNSVASDGHQLDADLVQQYSDMIDDRTDQLKGISTDGIAYGQSIPVYDAENNYTGVMMKSTNPSYDSTFSTQFPDSSTSPPAENTDTTPVA